jgi:hypothetical protein
MSGAQTSSFYPVNQLLVDNAQQIQNQYAPQRNELFVQREQQAISSNEIEMLARGSQSLLALGDEAKMAEQYPATVAELQRYGFAKNAPSVFPGKARLQQIAAMGTSSEKQGERQGNIAVGRALVGDTGASAAAPGAAPAVAPGGGATFAGGIAGFEGGGNAMPPENPRWPVARGGPAGAHQFIASTWNEFAKANPDLFKGMSPEQILAARSDATPVGPNGESRSTLATNWYAGENAKALTARNIEPTPTNLGISHALGAGGAAKVLSAPDNTPLSQVIPETIAQNPQYGRMTVGDLKRQYSRLGPVGGPGAPGTGGGVAARTGGVDVAGPPGTASGASPAPAAGQFSPLQRQQLRVLAEAGRPTSEIIALQNQFRDENRAAADTAYTRQRQAQEDALKHQDRLDRIAKEQADAAAAGRKEEAAAKGAQLEQEKFTFNQANTLRDEATKITETFRPMQEAYERLGEAAALKNAQGDLGLIYTYTRMLDPATVHEEEVKRGMNSGGYLAYIQGMVARVQNGELLTPDVRAQFLDAGRKFYDVRRKGYEKELDVYRNLAKKFNLDPDTVAVSVARDQPAAPDKRPPLSSFQR